MAGRRKTKQIERIVDGVVGRGESLHAAGKAAGCTSTNGPKRLLSGPTGQDRLGKALERAGATEEYISSKLLAGAERGEPGKQLEYLDRIIRLRKLLEPPTAPEGTPGAVQIAIACDILSQGITMPDGEVVSPQEYLRRQIAAPVIDTETKNIVDPFG